MGAENSFNYLFLKRIGRLLRILLPFSRLSLNIHNYNERIYTHPLILVLLILINEVGLQYVIYVVGLLSSVFLDELTKPVDQRDFPAFRWLVVRSFALVILNALLIAASTFLSSILYVKWRMRLVLHLHSFYFAKRRYYHLLNTTQQNTSRSKDDNLSTYQNYNIQTMNIANNERELIQYTPTNSSRLSVSTHPSIDNPDNPDQRITQDADSLCRSLSAIISLIVISPFTIGYYTYQTWKVTGYYGPLGILIYFIIWAGINKIFISSVSRTIFKQNILEGNFRFLHTQIRTYNESIAFYNGGSFEHTHFDSYLVKILSPILYRRAIQQFFLSFSTNSYDYIGSIIKYLLMALAIFVFHFYDNLTISELIQKISQSSFMIGYLIYQFNKVNDLTDQITLIAANTHRVQEFLEYMMKIDTTWSEKQLSKNIEQDEILIIKNLSYSTPNNNKHIVIKNLNLTLNKRQHLLITGESGVGKTSLFRVLYSIWPMDISGSFSYKTAQAFLLPQRPYFTNKSLHDELSYPDVQTLSTLTSQIEIGQVLTQWNLEHILDCVESSVFTCPKYAWQDLLSPGELQRLSFVRLVLRLSSNQNNQASKTNLVFLDEITSSLDINIEMKMYNYLLEQDLTLVSIGHRETLRQYHHSELKLYKNGKYVIEKLQLSS
ncbi:unnamed protein product [Adineta steineri]|uniref:ABC transmembrane type-1 domain-containing protein n=1 Tax=Adineta steineri TaxID=433720 RepID=A0A815TM78_9BILA|nr:unnamed protein product [Adineta steineri]CAF3680777.1 unnamed protein product [Adineta steineri]